MSDFDIANLGTQAIEDGNEAPSEFYRPAVDPGKVTIRLKVAPTEDRFYGLKDFDTGAEIAGFSANAEWEVVGGVDDAKAFYAYIDTRKGFEGKMSLVKQYLLGGGYSGSLTTVQDYKDGLQTTFSAVPAIIGWMVPKCECGAKAMKQKDLSKKADNTYDHEVKCPDCNEKRGAKVKIVKFLIEGAKVA